ncbi:hypothetical protein KXD40_002874 [Peronospora effusa]|uniref:RxLR effector protein n=1 Tax=Peronospora effusa TaxID=542832 RepID=A0A3R7Y4V3_9STRA|nr:hypothetical protein DD237_008347 [Peronospora effusa]UIZ29917.1 hypothetical protein KXD40_002874 [Peronospora effusa]CAI5701671.1 unnamed protein product [Peronospora effusa]
MLNKPTKTPLAKTLFVILLVAPSTIVMSTADLSREDTPRILQASNALYEDLTIPASKQQRYMRTAADVTTISTGEVRRLNVLEVEKLESFLEKQESSLTASLHQNDVTNIKLETPAMLKARLWLGRFKKQTPLDAFEFLKLHKVEKPFESSVFPVWQQYVESHIKNTKESLPQVMFEAMVDAYNSERKLSKILVEAKTSSNIAEAKTSSTIAEAKTSSTIAEAKTSSNIAENILEYQTGNWVESHLLPNEVFNLLELRQLGNPKKLSTIEEWGRVKQRIDFIKASDLKEPFKMMRDTSSLGAVSKLSKPVDLTEDPLGQLWINHVLTLSQKGYTGKSYEHYKTFISNAILNLKQSVSPKAAIYVMMRVMENPQNYFLNAGEQKIDLGSFLKKFEPEKPMETSG